MCKEAKSKAHKEQPEELEKTRKERRNRKHLAANTERRWAPWAFIPAGLLGVFRMVIWNLAGNYIGLARAPAEWNTLIALGLIVACFSLMTLWKRPMGWKRAGGEAVGLFDAVILDHDGTIVDSRDAMVRAYTCWAGEYGASLNEMSKYMGMPSCALAETLASGAKHWDRAAERIGEPEISDIAGVIPIPGAVDAFRVLSSDAVAVATSCTQTLLDARLNAAGLFHPRVVVTCDQVERGKPAPDSFLLVTKRPGAEPSCVPVVEDALADIAAAWAGGFSTLGILSAHTADALRADVYVTDPSQVTRDVSDEGIRVTVHDTR